MTKQGKRVTHAIAKILAIAALFLPLASYSALLMSTHGVDRDVLNLAWSEQTLILVLLLLPALTLRHLRMLPAPTVTPHEMEF